jgi:hypothetical protein
MRSIAIHQTGKWRPAKPRFAVVELLSVQRDALIMCPLSLLVIFAALIRLA